MKAHKKADVGYITNYTVANPAAGAGFVVNAPVGMIWRINSLRFQLVTSVVVANRTVLVQVFDGADELGSIISTYVHPASITAVYSLVDGQIFPTALFSSNVGIPWNGRVWVDSGYGLRILVAFMDGADQITDIRGRAEAWFAD